VGSPLAVFLKWLADDGGLAALRVGEEIGCRVICDDGMFSVFVEIAWERIAWWMRGGGRGWR